MLMTTSPNELSLSLKNIYEMSIKCPVYEMSCLWNVLSMKCLVYEMSDYEMSFYEMSHSKVMKPGFLINRTTCSLILRQVIFRTGELKLSAKNNPSPGSKLGLFDVGTGNGKSFDSCTDWRRVQIWLNYRVGEYWILLRSTRPTRQSYPGVGWIGGWMDRLVNEWMDRWIVR